MYRPICKTFTLSWLLAGELGTAATMIRDIGVIRGLSNTRGSD